MLPVSHLLGFLKGWHDDDFIFDAGNGGQASEWVVALAPDRSGRERQRQLPCGGHHHVQGHHAHQGCKLLLCGEAFHPARPGVISSPPQSTLEGSSHSVGEMSQRQAPSGCPVKLMKVMTAAHISSKSRNQELRELSAMTGAQPAPFAGRAWR